MSRYVSRVATVGATGVVTVTAGTGIGSDVDGLLLTLIPQQGDGSAAAIGMPIGKWICGGTGTSILPKYLPGSCRGT